MQRSPSKHILVLDDNLTVRRFLESTLLQAGYSVISTAWSTVGESSQLPLHDLVLMDPAWREGADPAVCLELMRRRGLVPTEVIWMSDAVASGAETGAVPAGFAGRLTKPFTSAILLAAVAQALERPPVQPEPEPRAEAAVAAASPNGPAAQIAAPQPAVAEPALAAETPERTAELAPAAAPASESPAAWNPEGASIRHLSELLASTLHGALDAARQAKAPTAEAALEGLSSSLLAPAFLDSLAQRGFDTVSQFWRQGLTANGQTLSLSEVLNPIAGNQSTGILTVTAPRSAIELHLFRGKVRFLNPRRIHLGAYADVVYSSRLTLPRKALEEALQAAATDGDSLYFHLEKAGVVATPNIRELMLSLGVEVLCEALAESEHSWYQLRTCPNISPSFLEHGVEIQAQRLLLMLYSRMDEWKLLEREVLRASGKFALKNATGPVRISSPTQDHLVVIKAVDGARTVEEIAAVCKLGLFETCKIIKKLKEASVLVTNSEP